MSNVPSYTESLAALAMFVSDIAVGPVITERDKMLAEKAQKLLVDFITAALISRKPSE